MDDVLKAILQESRASSGGGGLGVEAMAASWSALVGEHLARRTRPRQWSGGRVTIEVASHAWLQELSFRRAELLERISRLWPEPIEGIDLTVSPSSWEIPVEEARAPREVVDIEVQLARLTEAEREDLARLDEDLQRRLLRIYAKIGEQAGLHTTASSAKGADTVANPSDHEPFG